MELKKVNPLSKNRTKLLGHLLKLDIPMKTILKIGRMLENKTDVQKEELASQMLDKIIDCKSEKEILSELYLWE